MSHLHSIYRKMAVKNPTKGVEVIQKMSLSTETLYSKYIFMSDDAFFVTTPQAPTLKPGVYKVWFMKNNPDRSAYQGYRC